jgi:hypothetical protein
MLWKSGSVWKRGIHTDLSEKCLHEEIKSRWNSAAIRFRFFCLPVLCLNLKTYEDTHNYNGALCSAWHLTSREGRLKTVLFGPKWEEVTGIWRVSLFVLHARCYYNDEMRRDKFGGECSSYGRKAKCLQNFGKESWKKETNAWSRHKKGIILK